MMATANVLDPVHETLDLTVWDSPHEIAPVLKVQHRDWLINTITSVLAEHGYGQVPEWLELYLTGSLTTYQYSEDSDCDVSLFVNTDVFPEWSRAEMIGVMVENFDGQILPGTSHPVQGYVVQKGLRPEDLYKPGLRSGYDIYSSRWITPPEKDRVHDVSTEYNGFYVYAMEQADKMERLLRYEPDKAVSFWHQIHQRRMRDHKAGKGDFSESNIVYKFLNNRGLFPQISEVSGEHIAAIQPYFVDHKALEIAARHPRLNLKHPVQVNLVDGTHGQYLGLEGGHHVINLVKWLKPESASRQLWHELVHARQFERDPDNWEKHKDEYWQTRALGYDQLRNHPWEIEAHDMADENPFPLTLSRTAADKPRVIYQKFRPEQLHRVGPEGPELPFTYVPENNTVFLGPPNSFHWELISKVPELKTEYPMERAWQNAPALENVEHIHGRMSWPSKQLHWVASDPSHEIRTRIAEALGAPVPEPGPEDGQDSWTFSNQQLVSSEAST